MRGEQNAAYNIFILECFRKVIAELNQGVGTSDQVSLSGISTNADRFLEYVLPASI